MDLLLQAARVLELEQPAAGEQGATRGTYYLQHGKSKTEISDKVDGSQLYDESWVVTGDDDMQFVERTSRRVGGVGTREVHNQLEKNRRKQLREFFTHLQQCVPSLENKRVATQSILQGAIKHIKNLKKKDVEQEREIQMLAKKKSELKKKYDLELNKCTAEQQHTAEILLKVVRSKVNVVAVEEDGHTSDSTSTASEGPYNEEDLSDGDVLDGAHQSVKSSTWSGNCEVNKRKLPSRASLPQAGIEPPSSSSRSGTCARSLVSSSSVALKQMLEQRKKNQAAVGQANSVLSDPRGAQVPTVTARGPGSLTYSHPMITTHLASAVRPSTSGASQTNHRMSQSSSTTSISSTLFNKNCTFSPASSSSSPCPTTSQASVLTDKGRKAVHIRSTGGTYITDHTQNCPLSAQIMSSSSINVPSESPLTNIHNHALFPTGITLLQPPALPATADIRKLETSVASPHKSVTSGLDLQSLSYFGQAVMATQARTLAMESPTSTRRLLDAHISSPKVTPTVIPLPLTPILRGLPVTGSLPHMVALASSPLALCSTTSVQPATSVAEAATSSSKIQLSQGASYLLTSSPATTQRNSLSSTNSARIAALLSATSTHISNSLIKPTSPNNNLPSISLPGTLGPTLLPLSLAGGALATNTPSTVSQGSPLRIFTPLSHNTVLTTSLTNGQPQLLPAVVQLDTSGQVALLHNLMPGRNQHHILAQPIVVMATAGSDFITSSNTTTTSPSHVL